MFKRELFQYKKEDATVISIRKPDCEYTVLYRLIAETDDLLLTDGIRFVKCIDVQENEIDLWFEVNKNDLEERIPQIQELKNLLVEYEKKIKQQEELIDILLIATDEMYMMIEGDLGGEEK